MSGHISPIRNYLVIFGALMVGTVVTVLAAMTNLGALNFPVAIAIAITKATLVILFFMHVKYSSRMTKLIVGTAFFFLAILFVETMMDYVSRRWYVAPGGSTSPGSIERLMPAAEAAPAPAESAK
jgi:cytochrome c oxidase subunit 4